MNGIVIKHHQNTHKSRICERCTPNDLNEKITQQIIQQDIYKYTQRSNRFARKYVKKRIFEFLIRFCICSVYFSQRKKMVFHRFGAAIRIRIYIIIM